MSTSNTAEPPANNGPPNLTFNDVLAIVREQIPRESDAVIMRVAKSIASKIPHRAPRN